MKGCFLFLLLNCIYTIAVIGYDAELVHLTDPMYDQDSISVLGALESGMRGLTMLIQDGYGRNFVIKQYKMHEFETEFGVVRETLASYVGESVGIPLNRVRIIPAAHNFPGKIFPDRPATVHTYANGMRVDRHPVYSILTLRQCWKSEIPFKKRGLTYKIIKCMALHPDLPSIVAFDTFVSNSGRLNKNLFYDDASNTFCGIDLEQSFRKPFDYNFAQISCHNVRAMIEDKALKFTQKEYDGLVAYVSVLKRLITSNDPAKLHALLNILLFQSGLNPGLYINNEKHVPKLKIAKYISAYKKRINSQYKSAKELVLLLEELLELHKKH